MVREGRKHSETLGKCLERFVHRSRVSEYASRARGSSSVLTEVSIDVFVNLRSFAKTLSRSRVLWRSSGNPGPDRLSWINHGNSVSSGFCLFVAPEIPSGYLGHFEPTDSSLAVSDLFGSPSAPW